MVVSTVCYWVRVNACTCCSVGPCRAFWARTHLHVYGKHGNAQIRSKVAMEMRSVSITNIYLTIEEATHQVCRLTASLCPGSAIFRMSFRFLLLTVSAFHCRSTIPRKAQAPAMTGSTTMPSKFHRERITDSYTLGTVYHLDPNSTRRFT